MKNEKEIVDALEVGTILHGKTNHYRIIKPLGQGAFGITYLANVIICGELGTIETEIKVAIKEFFMEKINSRINSTVISSRDDGYFGYYKERFVKEASNLGKLRHPNIIKVIEQFEENSTAYYVMEYIEGGNLSKHIYERKALSPSETIRRTLEIAEALKYMHSHNMLHLDLKPVNIMVKESGESILIDFGLSKQFDLDGKPETSTSIGLGTPGYAPVEQANFRKEDYNVLPATLDIYALGGTMFKMITGSNPPEASEILNEGFPSHELAGMNCSPNLTSIIEKCMAPKRKERYQTIKEVIYSLTKGKDTEVREDSQISINENKNDKRHIRKNSKRKSNKELPKNTTSLERAENIIKENQNHHSIETYPDIEINQDNPPSISLFKRITEKLPERETILQDLKLTGIIVALGALFMLSFILRDEKKSSATHSKAYEYEQAIPYIPDSLVLKQRQEILTNMDPEVREKIFGDKWQETDSIRNK